MDENEEIRQTDDEQQMEKPQEMEQPEPEMAQEPEAEPEQEPETEGEPEAEPETQQAEEPEQEQEPEQPVRTFTQEEVNEIVGKTRSEARKRAINEIMEKYGFDDASQLDDLVGASERYEELSGQQEGYEQEMESLRNENLLLKSGIDPDRFEDVMAYFSYKKMPINPVTLEDAMSTHPEWTGFDEIEEEEEPEEKPSVVRKLGNSPVRRDESNPAESEESRAMKMFGL